MRIYLEDFLKLSFRAVQQEISNPTSGAEWLCDFMSDHLEQLNNPQLDLLYTMVVPKIDHDDDECPWGGLADEIGCEAARREHELPTPPEPEPTGWDDESEPAQPTEWR